MGCMAQKEGEQLRKRVPYVDLVVGPRQLGRIPDLVEQVRTNGTPVVEVSQDLKGGAPLPLIPLGERRATPAAGSAGGAPLPLIPLDAPKPARDGDEAPSASRGALAWDEHVAAPRDGGRVAREDDLTAGFAPVGTQPPGRAGDRRLKPFVSVIQGCNYRCTYCIVPLVRGREYSRPAAEVVREVRWLLDHGFKEVTLLGQNILSWGNDIGPTWDFPRLLECVNEVEGLERIRFTSAHPREVTDRLIDAVAELPKVCEHFHLPLQAGDDRLLKRMARGHTVASYEEMAAKIRARVPGASLTTDLIVGFPGETEEHVENYLATYRRLRFDQAFMFAYSPRPGTYAAKMEEQVPHAVQIARLQRVIEQQNRISEEVNRAQEGQVAEVLVEGPSEKNPEKLTGRTRTNKPVVLLPPDGARAESLINELVPVRLTRGHLWGFAGEVVAAVAA